MSIIDGDPDQNRHTLLNLISSDKTVQLYLAPELWTTGYSHECWAQLSLEDTPKTLEWLAEQCRHRGVWFGGSLVARNAVGQMVNRFFMLDPSGCLIATYDKSHLFHPMKEHLYLKRGEQLPEAVHINDFHSAPAICFDLRFPEMFRSLAIRGVNLYLVSAEWPASRHAALRTLAEARALENQAFLILSNRVGQDSSGEVFAGRSAIFGPSGLICEAGADDGLVIADLDVHRIEKMRLENPIFSHRILGVDY